MQDLVAIDHRRSRSRTRTAAPRIGSASERRRRALRPPQPAFDGGGFAITGFFFIAWPDGTLARLTELGGHFGFDTPAPKTDERLWLSLGFAYMVVITFLALIAHPTSRASGR